MRISSMIAFAVIVCIAQDTNGWTRLASAPHKHAYFALAPVGGKLYTIGGSDDFVDCYDPVSGKWSNIGKMPSHRDFCGAAEAGGKIYAIGGTDTQGETYVPLTEALDPKTGRWERRSDMLTPRNRLTSVYLNGKIYAIGGMGADDTPGAGRNGTLSTVEEYDPGTDRWRTLARMPTPRRFLCCAIVGGKVYAIGGHYDVRTLEYYDPKLDLWAKQPDMPDRFARFGAAVSDAIYVVGGEDDGMAAWRFIPRSITTPAH